MSWGCGNPYGWCEHRGPDKLTEWQRCWKCFKKNMMPNLVEAKSHAPECRCYWCNPDDWPENQGRH